MDILSILLFVLGLAVGAFGVAVWLGAQSDRRVAEAEARVSRDLDQARRDALDADLAHHETKQRLIALQLEHERVKATVAAMPQAASPPAAPDDLKRIKGIGPSLERKLHELGITRLEQIARLSAVEVERIDAQLDFPGRIRRERWVEQARALLRP
mgnify:CR=1 FL=1